MAAADANPFPKKKRKKKTPKENRILRRPKNARELQNRLNELDDKIDKLDPTRRIEPTPVPLLRRRQPFPSDLDILPVTTTPGSLEEKFAERLTRRERLEKFRRKLDKFKKDFEDFEKKALERRQKQIFKDAFQDRSRKAARDRIGKQRARFKELEI